MSDPADDLDVLAEALVWLRVAYPDQIRGCTDAEVARVLAQRPGFAVPDHYLAFLHRMGRGAGRLWRGTDLFYPEAAQINEWAEESARDTSPPLTTHGRFFFASHQGYQFYFFEQGSPEVFMYTEGGPAAQRTNPSFLDFVWTDVRSSVITAMYGYDLSDYPAWPDQRPSSRGQITKRRSPGEPPGRKVSPQHWRRERPPDPIRDVEVLARACMQLGLLTAEQARGLPDDQVEASVRAASQVDEHHRWLLRRLGAAVDRLWPGLQSRPVPAERYRRRRDDYAFLDALWHGVRDAILESVHRRAPQQ
jgi:hypothetical protein